MLVLISTFPLIFNETLSRVADAFSALALSTFWTRYVAGVRGHTVLVRMFGGIPGLYTLHLISCGSQKCL